MALRENPSVIPRTAAFQALKGAHKVLSLPSGSYRESPSSYMGTGFRQENRWSGLSLIVALVLCRMIGDE